MSPGLAPPLAPPGLLPRVAGAGVACLLPRGAPGSCLAKMAPALVLRRRRRLRALGRRRRPLSLTESRGAGTRGAMAGGRRGAMPRPDQSNSARLPAPSAPRLGPAASPAPPWPPHEPHARTAGLSPGGTPRGALAHRCAPAADWYGLAVTEIAEGTRPGGRVSQRVSREAGRGLAMLARGGGCVPEVTRARP